ncbi:Uncharacterised protein [Vibrio cholerae]|nr:Uncharacterised protein [Vibrio cholerae]CSB59939.1 Uncharacterised protein [Vibrio cholerae]CSB68305.1 Uncharacterised protein [Vibrio cholerae]CSB84484.1 Uncharacterised protein [Vibrio cholerae]CSC54010.1 Uncharacterised protein [Vibrio cholerae]
MPSICIEIGIGSGTDDWCAIGSHGTKTGPELPFCKIAAVRKQITRDHLNRRFTCFWNRWIKTR